MSVCVACHLSMEPADVLHGDGGTLCPVCFYEQDRAPRQESRRTQLLGRVLGHGAVLAWTWWMTGAAWWGAMPWLLDPLTDVGGVPRFLHDGFEWRVTLAVLWLYGATFAAAVAWGSVHLWRNRDLRPVSPWRWLEQLGWFGASLLPPAAVTLLVVVLGVAGFFGSGL